MNPNWKGGSVTKACLTCSGSFVAKRANIKARFCSLKCVGISQRGKKRPPRARVFIRCVTCGVAFSIYRSHASRAFCCSKECSFKRRSLITSGSKNPNWSGGNSRFPYTFDFTKKISKRVIERFGFKCMSPLCRGRDSRLTTHHINYNPRDNTESNLISLCSSCNSRANFNRQQWQNLFTEILSGLLATDQKRGEEF